MLLEIFEPQPESQLLHESSLILSWPIKEGAASLPHQFKFCKKKQGMDFFFFLLVNANPAWNPRDMQAVSFSGLEISYRKNHAEAEEN